MAKPAQHNQPWTPAHWELRDLCEPDRRGDEDADGHSPHMKKSMKPGSRPYENSGGMRTAILDAMPH
jgi:hypothetical protein